MNKKIDFPIRVNKYLREKGIFSRREADDVIDKGLVLVNGKQASKGMMIEEKDKVTVKGGVKKVKKIYLAYNKPRGLSTQGERGEESVVNIFKKEGLFPVGRLDKESEGLLIITNDGRLVTEVTSPDSEIEKEYVVITKEQIRKGVENIFKKGMDTETFGRLKPAEAKIVARSKIKIILKQGRKHQIRVMLNDLGYTVKSLRRVRIGGVVLGSLKPGEVKEIDREEVKEGK